MYEELELISVPLRKKNGYRIFTDLHVKQFELARIAFHIEVLQKGLRKNIVEVVKLTAKKQYDKAIESINRYIGVVREEIKNANEAVEITKALLQGSPERNTIFLKRKEVSDELGITIDTLRNWEMNGLLNVKRKANGYRIYSHKDVQRLKIIRSLRCANYSLASILRMLTALDQDSGTDVEEALNTPRESEDIVSVCDNLVFSLHAAEENAIQIMKMLKELKKIGNPPL